MQFINYFFASVISFLGLLIGIILVKIAPEEQKPLEKKFSLARKFFLLLIFIFLIFYYIHQVYYSVILVLLLMFLLIVEQKVKNLLKKSIFIYSALGVLFFLSSNNLNLFMIESSLILLYGISTASLLYRIREKNFIKIFFYNIIFIVIANLLPFLAPYS